VWERSTENILSQRRRTAKYKRLCCTLLLCSVMDCDFDAFAQDFLNGDELLLFHSDLCSHESDASLSLHLADFGEEPLLSNVQQQLVRADCQLPLTIMLIWHRGPFLVSSRSKHEVLQQPLLLHDIVACAFNSTCCSESFDPIPALCHVAQAAEHEQPAAAEHAAGSAALPAAEYFTSLPPAPNRNRQQPDLQNVSGSGSSAVNDDKRGKDPPPSPHVARQPYAVPKVLRDRKAARRETHRLTQKRYRERQKVRHTQCGVPVLWSRVRSFV